MHGARLCSLAGWLACLLIAVTWAISTRHVIRYLDDKHQFFLGDGRIEFRSYWKGCSGPPILPAEEIGWFHDRNLRRNYHVGDRWGFHLPHIRFNSPFTGGDIIDLPFWVPLGAILITKGAFWCLRFRNNVRNARLRNRRTALFVACVALFALWWLASLGVYLQLSPESEVGFALGSLHVSVPRYVQGRRVRVGTGASKRLISEDRFLPPRVHLWCQLTSATPFASSWKSPFGSRCQSPHSCSYAPCAPGRFAKGSAGRASTTCMVTPAASARSVGPPQCVRRVRRIIDASQKPVLQMVSPRRMDARPWRVGARYCAARRLLRCDAIVSLVTRHRSLRARMEANLWNGIGRGNPRLAMVVPERIRWGFGSHVRPAVHVA